MSFSVPSSIILNNIEFKFKGEIKPLENKTTESENIDLGNNISFEIDNEPDKDMLITNGESIGNDNNTESEYVLYYDIYNKINGNDLRELFKRLLDDLKYNKNIKANYEIVINEEDIEKLERFKEENNFYRSFKFEYDNGKWKVFFISTENIGEGETLKKAIEDFENNL